jgi:hypothetical protein
LTIARSAAASIFYLVAAIILFTPFSLIDFDPHHDGYMLAQAVAINQGGLVYLDAFAQYGPITPWFQSIFTFLFSEFPAVGLRFSNVIVLALTVFVLADFGRNMPAWWPIKSFSARLAALIWILTADFFYSVPMLPWSSALATLLALSSIYFFGRASNKDSTRIRLIYFSLAGAMAGLTIFTRVNVGLPLLAVVVGLAVLAFLGKIRIQKAYYFAFGFLGAVSLILVILSTTGSLEEAIKQSLLWPLQWSGADNSNPGATLLQPVLNLFPAFIIPIAFILAWTINNFLFRDKWKGSKIFGQITLLGSAVSILATTLFEASGKSQVPMAIRTMPFTFVEKVALIYQFLATAGISLALVMAIMASFKLLKRENPNEIHSNWALIGLCGVGLATIVQITPVADSRHIWWGLPPLLLLLVNVFSVNSSSFFDFFRNPLVYSMAALFLFASLIGASNLIIQREQIGKISIAEGMRNFPDEAKSLEISANELATKVSDRREGIFFVDDGYLSVADGKYRSLDKNFVLWGPSEELSKRLMNAQYVLIATQDEPSAATLLRSNFRVKSEFGKYSLYVK